jgi:hypothetical protein
MAVFTVTLDDKVSGASEKVVGALGDMIGRLQGVGVAVDQVNVKMGAASSAATGVAGKFGSAIDPMSGLEAAATGLGAALNPVTIGLAAVAAAAAATIAVVTGVAAALYAGAKAALRFADMRGDLESSLNVFVDGGGKGAIAMIDQLGERLPFTTERMGEWAKGLAAAGVRDLPGLQRGIQAAAAATAIANDATDGTAQKVVGLIQRFSELGEVGANVKLDKKLGRQLASVGLDMNDLSKELGIAPEKMNGAAVSAAKLGSAIQDAIVHKGKGALENFAEDFDQIGVKFKEAIGFMFEGVSDSANGFLHEVRLIAEEFTHGTASADLAKGGITAVFNALFTVATAALHAIHVGFLDIEIAGLRAAIAIAPVVRVMRNLWAAADEGGGAQTMVGTLGLLADSATSFGDALTGLPIGGTISSIFQIYSALADIPAALSAAAGVGSAWASSAYSTASDFVSGLVNGITDGIGRVVDAAEKLGESAVDAVRGVLGIHSPSVVMGEVGVNTAAGMAIGIEDGQERVASAARSLGGAAASGAASSSSSSTSSSNVTLTAQLTINNYGGADMSELTEQGFGSLLERLAMQAGLVSAGAPA